MSKLQIFARLVKVDEAKRTITGVIANETPDMDGEIFDYDSSKPNFEKWSKNIAKASGGKSVGNVRAMHGKVAAGRLNEIIMDDAAKQIEVTAEIVDDNEFNKALKGVYTGFSIGGSYGKKWDDGPHKRYTALPTEVSLADVPCNLDCTFSVLKTDGSTDLRKFAGADSSSESTEDDNDVPAAPALSQDQIDSIEKMVVEGFPGNEELQKTARAYFTELLQKAAASDDTPQSDPLFDKIIEKCASNDDAKRTLIAMLDMAEPARPELAKGMCDAASLCDLFERLGYQRSNARWEAQMEGDNSKLPGMFDGVLRSLADVLIAMVKEETQEVIAKAVVAGDLNKSITVYADAPEELEKVAKCESIEDLRVVATSFSKALGASARATDKAIETLGKAFDGKGVISSIEKMLKEKDALADSLRKHHAQIGELNAAATALNKQLKTANEELETLRKVAATPANNGKEPVLRAVEKGEDVSNAPKKDEVQKVMGMDGKPDDAATMIKNLHAQGGRQLLSRAP